LPGILLHALHNGLLLSVAYYRDQLLAMGWGVEESRHLPLSWLGAAAAATLIGIGLLIAGTWSRRPAASAAGALQSRPNDE
jgi:ABC-2 type transport system permease protein/sodium transport system permease protein